MTDGTMDWLWPAAEKAGMPIALMASNYLPQVGADRRAPPRPEADHRPLAAGLRGGTDDAAHANQPAIAGARQISRTSRSRRPARRAIRASPTRSATSTNTCSRSSTRSGPQRMLLGHRHHPDAVLVEAMRDDVHRGAAVAQGPRPRTGDGPRACATGSAGNCPAKASLFLPHAPHAGEEPGKGDLNRLFRGPGRRETGGQVGGGRRLFVQRQIGLDLPERLDQRLARSRRKAGACLLADRMVDFQYPIDRRPARGSQPQACGRAGRSDAAGARPAPPRAAGRACARARSARCRASSPPPPGSAPSLRAMYSNARA